ncbi:glutamine-rich protein 2 [Rhinopithecus roxellana]|uniref:glutamine-rich protein 2 n=1 Tax=Rhinopithecus roxellana TaxID=61622 RepID=UPI001237978F|nr:glutamine-rich protein 2 [Rhinopithecus roxellana]
MENSVSEASLYLQDQLDKLRMIIESMLTSSSTLLSMSMAPHKAHTLAPGQIDPEATCPACSLDVGHQVSMLVQRYEQLQNMVNSLVVSRPSKKAKLQRQDEELLGRVQSAILQVQGDCEKLNITTSNLIEDHRQKQKDIAMLYQGLEKLEKEKANREHLEMEIDVKADKSALATKVSRIQFDATTEQLNHMMQELVAKMSGQEQDWQKMLDKLLTEMDNKLDRLELDPVKQLLEDRWKSLRQQLRERPPLYQADEAAAMRRQLLAHFHCLSCDRPLETPVTGHAIPVTPAGPGLPGHHSIRPYTVFELEQVRQHSRNLKLGSAFPRGDLAQMEQSVGRLRSMHSKMLMNIEKVQIHFGGSTKASSQIIRELLHAQCLGSPCYKRVTDMADYTYSTVPRRCGGSHTLTYPYHRSRPQHPPRGLYPTEEIQIAMKRDEVDILGLDGHIYKGRMDTRLPGILSKDSSGTSKRKSQQPRPHVHRPPSLGGNGHLPSRPQSAQMSAGNISDRQTFLRGPSLPAEHSPPAQLCRGGRQGAGEAHGRASWGGARGAHAGAAVQHCSVSGGINKCSGGSLGQQCQWLEANPCSWLGRFVFATLCCSPLSGLLQRQPGPESSDRGLLTLALPVFQQDLGPTDPSRGRGGRTGQEGAAWTVCGGEGQGWRRNPSHVAITPISQVDRLPTQLTSRTSGPAEDELLGQELAALSHADAYRAVGKGEWKQAPLGTRQP